MMGQRIGALIVDILETWSGDWFTEAQIVSMTTTLRPGIDVGSVERTLRELRTRGFGKAADKTIVFTSSGGPRRRCRKVPIETRQGSEAIELRVVCRGYW
jgi:hypothetical protein